MKRLICSVLIICISFSFSGKITRINAAEKQDYYEIIDVVDEGTSGFYLRYEAYVNNTSNHKMWLNTMWLREGDDEFNDMVMDSYTEIKAGTTFDREDDLFIISKTLANYGSGNYTIKVNVCEGVEGDTKGHFGKRVYSGQNVKVYIEVENKKIKSIKRTDYTKDILLKIAQKDCKKNGHIYDGGWIIEKEATVSSEGAAYRICSRCGHKDTISLIRLNPKKNIEQKVKLKLNKTKLKLKKKKKYLLKIKSKAKGDHVKKWRSTNKKIARVSKKGKVTAVKKGKCTIKVFMKSGAVAKCKVTVR